MMKTIGQTCGMVAALSVGAVLAAVSVPTDKTWSEAWDVSGHPPSVTSQATAIWEDAFDSRVAGRGIFSNGAVDSRFRDRARSSEGKLDTRPILTTFIILM